MNLKDEFKFWTKTIAVIALAGCFLYGLNIMVDDWNTQPGHNIQEQRT